jgi:hypothetical protein
LLLPTRNNGKLGGTQQLFVNDDRNDRLAVELPFACNFFDYAFDAEPLAIRLGHISSHAPSTLANIFLETLNFLLAFL